MSHFFSPLSIDKRGSAAVEMALVMPMLLTLMFGSFELGNYFLENHIVAKAVRDGARYAARLPVSSYSCPVGNSTGSIISNANAIKEVTRTGTPDGSGTPKLGYWTNAGSTVTIDVACKSTGTYKGLYYGLPGDVPIITVSANISYRSLFGRLGWSIGQNNAATTTLNLTAKSQAAAVGI
jgi:Flp pilus assembly protein TadG